MKKSLVFLFIICMSISLISFNIVKTSAEDEQNEPEVIENLKTNDEEEEKIKDLKQLKSQQVFTNNENDVIEISNFAELRDFLKSNDTKVGKLTGDSYVITTGLAVNGNKTLDLNGKTIEADDSYSGNMFVINGSLTINDSTVSELKPYGSGRINGNYIEGSSENNDFIRGFYVESNKILTINGGTIENMYVSSDSDVSGGGAISNKGTVYINGGLITNCRAYYGGAIFNYSTVIINGGTIESCTTDENGSGGAINNDSDIGNATIVFNDGLISKCNASYGGAISNCGTNKLYTANVFIGEGTIDSCEAYADGDGGGAIFSYASKGPTEIIIEDGTISNCKATGTNGYGYGGAIINWGGTNVDGSYSAKVTINGGTIVSCSASCGGAIYSDSWGPATITINDGTIDSCKATYGGAIYNNGDNSNHTALVTIAGGTIDSCEASASYDGGGAIFNYAKYGPASIVIEDGTISNCKATNNHGYGGAIINWGGKSDENADGYLAKVTIEGGTIDSCSAYYGGAIFSDSWGPATINISDGTISNCYADFGGAIYNSGDNSSYTATVKITGGTIDSCKAKMIVYNYCEAGAIMNYASSGNAELIIEDGTIQNCESEGYAGAIYNYGELIINDCLIKDCYSQWYGGAIYTNNYAKINGGTIQNCESNERGGAIINYDQLIINGGLIKDCYSPYSAIYHDGSDFILNGDAKLDNYNKSGYKDDICVTSNSYITVDDGFIQEEGEKIAIWSPTGNFHDTEDVYTAVVKGTYQGTIDELSNNFKSAHGQEFITIDDELGTLSLNAVILTQQPNYDNGYTVDTNVLETKNPIEVTYQWYKSIIDEEVEINEPDDYSIGTTNFNVSEVDGSYDYENEIWSIDIDYDEGIQNIFKISGLEKGQVISFNYKTNDKLDYLMITLRDEDDNYYCQYIGNNSEGKFTAIVPEELENKDIYVKFAVEKDDNPPTHMEVTNIYVKDRQDPEAIKDATSATLVSAEQKADNFCRLTFENTDDGSVNYIDSFDVNFGIVSTGDNQTVKKGVVPTITFKTDLSLSDIEIYVDSVSDENKLTIGQDYAIAVAPKNELQTCTLTIETSSAKIPSGNHKYYVKSNSKSGYETIIFSLNVQEDGPTPTPTPKPAPKKDESCEKVIGPTWHWNNKKGICEDSGSVKTDSK